MEEIRANGGIRTSLFSPSKKAVAKAKDTNSALRFLNSWEEIGGSDDPHTVAALWHSKGFTEAEWDEDGSLLISSTMPGEGQII